VAETTGSPRLYAYDGIEIESIVSLSNSSLSSIAPVVWSDHWFARGGSNCYRWSPDGGDHIFTCDRSPLLAALPDGVIHGRGSNGNREIWNIDAAGQTTQLTNFASFSSFPEDFTWLGDEVFFAATDGISGVELWISDATETGTRHFDLAPGNLDSSPSHFEEFAGRLWFIARDGEGQRRLGFSDGTGAGTGFYSDLQSELFASSDSRPLAFANALYVELEDPDGGLKLARVTAIDQPPVFFQFESEAFYAYGKAASSQQLFVIGWTESTGVELFAISSDGSQITALEILPGQDDVSPYEESLAIWNDQAFFVAEDDEGLEQLWRSDGQTPVQLTGFDGGRTARDQIIAGPGGAYFIYRDASNTCVLARSDGQSVVLLPLPESAECPDFEPSNGRVAATDDWLYFTMNTDEEGTELWITDGLSPPRVLDLRPGSGSSSPRSLAAYGSRLMFAASDGVFGNELWLADGDRAGLLVDLWPGLPSSEPDRIILHPDGRRAVFAANDPEAWREPHWIDIDQALRIFSDRFESN